VERIWGGGGVRRSLRPDEMDGSISQPAISWVKDKAEGGGRERETKHIRSRIAGTMR
jgi:hypothetical protein